MTVLILVTDKLGNVSENVELVEKHCIDKSTTNQASIAYMR